MALQNYESVKTLLQSKDDAYKLYATTGINADFAEFVSLSYSDFKPLLKRPDLTRQQLKRLVRHGYFSHKQKAPNKCWASYLAKYIAVAGNESKLATYK